LDSNSVATGSLHLFESIQPRLWDSCLLLIWDRVTFYNQKFSGTIESNTVQVLSHHPILSILQCLVEAKVKVPYQWQIIKKNANFSTGHNFQTGPFSAHPISNLSEFRLGFFNNADASKTIHNKNSYSSCTIAPFTLLILYSGAQLMYAYSTCWRKRKPLTFTHIYPHTHALYYHSVVCACVWIYDGNTHG
jgi:hypothetical protein